MANATKYVDNVNGNNGNTGNSEAQAYADLATALAAITGGGNTIHIQAGANYTYTATEAFPAGVKGDTTDGPNYIIGYTTTPGARDGRPVLTSATSGLAIFTLNDNDFWKFIHLKFTHTGSPSKGIGITGATSNSASCTIDDCVFDGCSTAINAAAGLTLSSVNVIGTEITNSTGTGLVLAGTCTVYGCDIHDNTGVGIRFTTGTHDIHETILDTNSIGIEDASSAATSSGYTLHGCTVVDNSGAGAKVTTARTSGSCTLSLSNNIFYGNGTYGVDNAEGAAETDLLTKFNCNNAYGGNGTAARNNLNAGRGDVTLTGDPFTNKASRDFSLDNTASEGAACRAAAYPGAFVSGTTTSYRDIGAAQHQDSGGAGIKAPLIGPGQLVRN